MKLVLLAVAIAALLGGCSSTCKDIKGGMSSDVRACKKECLRQDKEKRKSCQCSTMCPCWREH